MKNIHKNQSGVAALTIVGLLLIFAVVGFTGWRVWEARKVAKAKLDAGNPIAATKTETKKETQTEKLAEYKLPDGFVWYENKELGFKFAYPKEYGTFSLDSKTQEANPTVIKSVYVSGEPKTTYAPGVTGAFTVTTYKYLDSSINTYKYGPAIQYKDGKWIVLDTNPADPGENKVGQQYQDRDKKSAQFFKSGDLTVYLFPSVDEGTTVKRFRLVSNKLVHDISLPAFSDGTYSGTTNDPSLYNQTYDKVRESIRVL